ncbi:MAG: carboxypeptidase-like regulatory domain-containing protein [Dysgonamonadaceae bacterium]|jgi:hypothetical protein|nr:carboxypeptidase-like regulatory domain-containing protein [Dysgonamonadaceae bacterium]
MKTSIDKFKWSLCFACLLSAFSHIGAQDGTGYFTLSGTVKNANNKKAIEYAHLKAVGTSISTVTNEDGQFILKISADANVDEIEISCLGYYNSRIPFQHKDRTNIVVNLTPQPYPLKEIVVAGWEKPLHLIEAAIDRIDANYSQKPNALTAFYRETVQKKRKYINISEAVIDIYKTSYKQDVVGDRVQILKGRNLASPNPKDTLAVKLLGGPNLSIFLDIVKNPDILLSKEYLYLYDYRMGQNIYLDDRLQYSVNFKPQYISDIPLYEGVIYIDAENLSFSRIEFSMDMSDKEQVTRLILRHKPYGLRFTPEEVNYVVSYKYLNGKTVLSYLHNELKFKCDWKRKLFATNYSVVSEMVVTDLETENPEKISAKKAFSMNKSLSEEAPSYYDSDFWGAWNIIEPTESLESAVVKLKKER